MLKRYTPALVGETLREVDTPALCVDLYAMDENITRLSKVFNSTMTRHKQATIRPIVKAHKCSEIAKIQLSGGNPVKGVCCAKVCEAEAMMMSGIKDIYMSNEIIGKKKLDRLCNAMNQSAVSTIRCAVDSEIGILQLQQAAEQHDVFFNILIEVGVGQDRCGVSSVSEAVELSSLIKQQSKLSLIGIQGYQGAAQHIRSKEEMRIEISKVTNIVTNVRDAIIDSNLVDNSDNFVVTGAGSGSLEFELSSGVFTEIQPGSYLFNDVDYSKNLTSEPTVEEGDSKWKASLFILTTVMSKTIRKDTSWIVVDAGIKSHSIDSGPPRWYGNSSFQTVNGGDEHFKIICEDSNLLPDVGDKLLLQPGHVDPTFNMHDHVVAFRSSKLTTSSNEILSENPTVESVWEIDARGPGF